MRRMRRCATSRNAYIMRRCALCAEAHMRRMRIYALYAHMRPPEAVRKDPSPYPNTRLSTHLAHMRRMRIYTLYAHMRPPEAGDTDPSPYPNTCKTYYKSTLIHPSRTQQATTRRAPPRGAADFLCLRQLPPPPDIRMRA